MNIRKEQIINSPEFNGLPPREREILEMRFGLKDDVKHTRREIGEHLGVSPERIRQLEAKALWKLKISEE